MQAITLEDVYRRYFRLIQEKCRRMLGDASEAQDVAQETLIRLWKSGLAEKGAMDVTGWLYKTSTRLAIDHSRRKRVRDGFAGRAVEDAPPRSEGGLEQAVEVRQLFEHLARRVPGDQLTVGVLWHVDGLNQAEVAQVVGTSDRTVRRLLQRFEQSVAKVREEL